MVIKQVWAANQIAPNAEILPRVCVSKNDPRKASIILRVFHREIVIWSLLLLLLLLFGDDDS